MEPGATQERALAAAHPSAAHPSAQPTAAQLTAAQSSASPLPTRARIVVIGGGVGGASIAYHLAEAGETDVVLVDRAELTSGSTFHSAGLVGQLRADPALTRMNMYSVDLYRWLQQTDRPPGWVESGGIKLASSPERLAEIRRQVDWARVFGLPLHEISVDEAVQRFPLIDPDGLYGAAFLESDGHLDPSQLCQSLAAGARDAGVRIATHTRVLAIDTKAGRRGSVGAAREVALVRTDRGDIECEVVVDAGGIYAAEIGRLVGVRVPVVPIAHQYLVTEPLPPGALPDGFGSLPGIRDPDLLVYWRAEGAGLLMGGYERDPAPWQASHEALDDVPADFNGTLLAADWDRFEPLAANATVRVPLMADLGVRTIVNGPEAFTPDNEFCLGETGVRGFFVAAGFCAHGIAGAGGIGRAMAEWILTGDPGLDLWHMDISRFGPAYASPRLTMARTLENYRTYYDVAFPDRQRMSARPLRTSPAYEWHRARGACFGEKAGWERVEYYETNDALGDETLRPLGWAGRSWSPATGAEHHATRTTAGLFDESSFAKLEVSGPDAATLLERSCDNLVARAVGDITYTQVLNPHGGIEADVTVTRLDDDRFLVVTGTAFGGHDAGLLRRRAAGFGLDARVDDVTGSLVCFALWGPEARAVLGSVSPIDVSDRGSPFMTSQLTTVADVPVRASRVSFTGEHGWELYAGSEYGARLWQCLADEGTAWGLLPCGYRAIESLRLEKGYRVWGSDVTPETTPDEAGLGFCVRLDKPGGFVGDAALRAARDAGPSRVMCCIRIDDPTRIVLGGEPVMFDGEPVARVTSGGYGYTLGASLAYAYLPIELATIGSRVHVVLFGEPADAEVVSLPAVWTALGRGE